MNRRFTATLLIALVVSLALSSDASAHFPWLIRNTDNKAQLFFGEGLNDRTYKLPPAVAKADIHQLSAEGQATKLSTAAVEQADFVGLTSSQAVPSESMLSSSITYGVFRGSKLQYTALSYGKLPTDAQSVTLPGDLLLQAKVLDTDSGISVLVTWEGKPLPQAKVALYDANAEEAGEVETDLGGLVSFSDEQVHAGLNAIRVGHKTQKEGKLGDTAYSGETHYLTATFVDPEGQSEAELPALPFAITSFGAATDGKALYVFGGHMGDAHSYSYEEQSDKLLKLDLGNSKRQWEELATGNRVQGTAMVAYGDELIVVGGFQAKNKKGDDKELHSLADVRSFNTQTKQWSELPALPEPRSSHDAAIVGTSVYVVGGWKMAGDSETQWHTTVLKMDMAKSDRQWESIANPPFQRRALATIEHQGQLIVIGGMNQEGGPTKAVAAYDPNAQAWSSLPDIIGEKAMAGFGASGWSIDGNLIVTSQEGMIEQLDGDSWKVIGETKDARFFHRILPVGGSKLVAIGGANMGVGKFTKTEVIYGKKE